MEINVNGELVPVRVIRTYNDGKENTRIVIYVPVQDAYVAAELTTLSCRILGALVENLYETAELPAGVTNNNQPQPGS